MAITETIRAKGERRKRFERDADDALPLRLTERDIEIVRHVARHRFLRSDHIEHLVGDTAAAEPVARAAGSNICNASTPTPLRSRSIS